MLRCRAAWSILWHGPTALWSLDTSFPRSSPNPLGSKKSRCISIRINAVFDKSMVPFTGSMVNGTTDDGNDDDDDMVLVLWNDWEVSTITPRYNCQNHNSGPFSCCRRTNTTPGSATTLFTVIHDARHSTSVSLT